MCPVSGTSPREMHICITEPSCPPEEGCGLKALERERLAPELLLGDLGSSAKKWPQGCADSHPHAQGSSQTGGHCFPEQDG